MTKTSNKLKDYKKHRDLIKSTEPLGKSKSKKLKHPIFVIQKHDASHLHYDFRIEIDGVLKSWAIPKGPSTDPSKKRLAIPTDDHPLDYALFEGIIPEGNYGAGTVMVWDLGTYNNLREKNGKPLSMKECYRQGKFEINIDAQKIYGNYALIRTDRKQDEKYQWLLIKMKDEDADARRNPTSTENESILTGRILKEIEKEEK
ncbi:DNA ligase [Candidatus Dependentiae bacterium]|nr:DNA ligase [Candidatus Dependentiae bacterium]